MRFLWLVLMAMLVPVTAAPAVNQMTVGPSNIRAGAIEARHVTVDPTKLAALRATLGLTGLVDLTSAQTITGVKTFSNGFKLSDGELVTTRAGLVGPAGADGTQGPAGSQGVQGPAGPNAISTSTTTTGFTAGQIVGSDGTNVKVALAGTDYLTPTGSGTGLLGIPTLGGANTFTNTNAFNSTVDTPLTIDQTADAVTDSVLVIRRTGQGYGNLIDAQSTGTITPRTSGNGRNAGYGLYLRGSKGGNTSGIDATAGRGSIIDLRAGDGGDFTRTSPPYGGKSGYGGDVNITAGDGGSAATAPDGRPSGGGWVNIYAGLGGTGESSTGTPGVITLHGDIQATSLVDSTQALNVMNSSSSSAFMVDTDNMRVGINTWDPTDTLDVTGNIKASGTITGSGAGLTDIPDSALSSNVPLLNAANAYTNAQTYQPGAAYDTAALGAERLDDTTWNLGAGWAYVSGSDWTQGFQHTAGNTETLEQRDTCTTGTYYKVTWTISGRTAGYIGISYGGMGTSGITASGSFTLKASTTGYLIITPTTDFNGTVILSVLPVTSYDAALVVKDTVGDVDVEVRSSTKTLNNLYIGRNTGKWNTTGSTNVGIGPEALASVSSGDQNTAVGYNALGALQYGRYNTAIGSGALRQLTYGAYNIGIGYYAGNGITTQTGNVYIGQSSGNTAGGNNVGVGYQSLYSGGTSCVAIGYAAGKYASSVTGEFYINNKDQGNAATEKANSLLYGVMGANAAAQTLTVNGKLVTSVGLNIPTGTPASQTDTGAVGDIKWDASYLYVCTATNHWRRVALDDTAW